MFDYIFETVAEQQYLKKIKDVPIYDCVICNQTWLKKDVIEI